jgi:hypothetical protein
MFRTKTVEELLHFYNHYRVQYPNASSEGRKVLYCFLHRLRKLIKKRLKKARSQRVEA